MGIFAGKVDLYTTYAVTLQFRDKIMGGTPRDPKLIEGWIRSRMGIDEIDRLATETKKTMLEAGLLEGLSPEAIAKMTLDELEERAKKLGDIRQSNGFKRNDDGLYIESRTVKAMFKEVTNILFAGERWGATKKGPKAMVAERIFVSPDHISLGVDEPSGIDTFIGHVTGPQGPRSTMTRYEHTFQPRISFEVKVARDFMTDEQWALLWTLAEDNGLGSLRSQGYGCFDIEQWDVVKQAKVSAVA